MNKIMTYISALAAATALTISGANAQSSAPGSFTGSSVGSSFGSNPFAPDYLAFGYGLGSLDLTELTRGERVRVKNAHYADAILGWYLAEASSYPTFFQLGVFRVNGDVVSVANTTAIFPTTGSYTDWGGFLGLGIEVPLGGSSVASSAVASSAAGASSRTSKPITLRAAASVGVSKRKFDAFSGTFARNETGTFGRLEANLNIPLTNKVSVSPGVIYHRYSKNRIESDFLLAVLRLVWSF